MMFIQEHSQCSYKNMGVQTKTQSMFIQKHGVHTRTQSMFVQEHNVHKRKTYKALLSLFKLSLMNDHTATIQSHEYIFPLYDSTRITFCDIFVHVYIKYVHV
ncbi:hypothetical protein ACF0H5_004645 [Mactra antiquata]